MKPRRANLDDNAAKKVTHFRASEIGVRTVSGDVECSNAWAGEIEAHFVRILPIFHYLKGDFSRSTQ